MLRFGKYSDHSRYIYLKFYFMDKILCRNCQSLEEFLLEAACQSCQTPYYGYTPATLPERFKRILEEGAEDHVPAVTTGDLTEPEKIGSFRDHQSTVEKENGWLIVHTEGKFPIEFPLVEGKNYIGRPAEEIRPHIQVSEDQYVSRGHAVLEVITSAEGCRFLLTDNQENQRNKESLNGTHVNGNPERLKPEETAELRDGDTLQIGETKLVLKTPEIAGTVDVAKTQVQRMDYEKTIFKKV